MQNLNIQISSNFLIFGIFLVLSSFIFGMFEGRSLSGSVVECACQWKVVSTELSVRLSSLGGTATSVDVRERPPVVRVHKIVGVLNTYVSTVESLKYLHSVHMHLHPILSVVSERDAERGADDGQ